MDEKIQLLIWDLDNCLLDTKSMGKEIVKPVVSYIQSLNHFQENNILSDLWKLSLDALIKEYDLEEHRDNLTAAYISMRAPAQTCLYEDSALIQQINLPQILVTTGYEEFQKSKITVTGITDWFDEIIIDSIDNPQAILGKEDIFSRVAAKYGLSPSSIMVLGDSAKSELRAGKNLGMVTVQTLRPEVSKVEGFNHYVRSIEEVLELLKGS